MPVRKCSNGKYRIGSGQCMYTSRAKAERAMRAYYAQKNESATAPEEIRETIDLVETLLTQPRVLALNTTPYELSNLMKDFRAEQDGYNEIGNEAMVTFYTDQEQQEFERFLKKRGIKYRQIGDTK